MEENKLPQQICFVITDEFGVEWTLANYVKLKNGRIIFPKKGKYLKFPANKAVGLKIEQR